MVKRVGFRTQWLSAYAGSNPVSRIFKRFINDGVVTRSMEKGKNKEGLELPIRNSSNVNCWHEHHSLYGIRNPSQPPRPDYYAFDYIQRVSATLQHVHGRLITNLNYSSARFLLLFHSIHGFAQVFPFF